MLARREAFAFNPETPALREEEIVMDTPFCCIDKVRHRVISAYI
jgi:hypothetical protein